MIWLLQLLLFFMIVTQICFAQWFQQSSGTTVNLNAVAFTDANNGFVAGDSGIILYTSNGGSTWDGQISGTTNSLNDLCFIDGSTGYAIGDNDTILKTSDGGMLWTQLPSGTQNNLSGVCFIDSDNVWVVGGYSYWPDDYSIILKTTNGGINWTQWIFEDTTSLNDVFFTDINYGWVVGWKNYPNYEGIILRTTNGGTDWTHQTSGTDWPLNGVHFINQDIGWIVGGKTGPLPLANKNSSSIWENGPGIVLKTVDGGMTWVTQVDTISDGLFGVSFLDSSVGFAVGYSSWLCSGCLGASIIRTSDGGVNWTAQVVEDQSSFYDVNFIDANNGWVVGYHLNWDSTSGYSSTGAILHTTNGGVTFIEEEQIEKIPIKFSLSQNYPNPFNPSTKIKYSVPQISQVQIKVFDVLGNEIETLVNEEKPAGTYELSWNAANLPSGVYFYQLFVSAFQSKDNKAWSFVESKKMLFLK